MSIENKDRTNLLLGPPVSPVMRSTLAQNSEVQMIDFYLGAIDSFHAHLDWIEKQGRKGSPDWYLTNGLLRLAQGLQQDHQAEEERLKSFARRC